MPPKSNIARNVKKAVQKVDHKNKVFTHIPAQARMLKALQYLLNTKSLNTKMCLNFITYRVASLFVCL